VKTSFIFGAILASSAVGAWTADTRVKTVFLLLCSGFSIYGLARIFG
jgi:hypothetical protein